MAFDSDQGSSQQLLVVRAYERSCFSQLPIPQSVQVQTTDFVGQPFINIRSIGPLRDASGKLVAVMMMFEHESRKAAEEFADSSPYIRAGLLEDHRLYEYDDEVG